MSEMYVKNIGIWSKNYMELSQVDQDISNLNEKVKERGKHLSSNCQNLSHKFATLDFSLLS